MGLDMKYGTPAIPIFNCTISYVLQCLLGMEYAEV